MHALESQFLAALSRPEEALLELDRLECEESLAEFVRGGWQHIDPAPYVGGWHLDAIAEHLEAVAWGHLQYLLINVPPRSSKSSLVSVAFPAWVWAQRDKLPLCGPQVQILSASYAHKLALRDSVKTRRLIQSPWYQKRWGDRFQLTGDQNQKERFENTAGGYRLATSVDGTLTGDGGNIIIVDDPINAKESLSDAVRESTNEWWDGSMSTRRNNPKTDAFVVVMQRLHEDDTAGHILSNSEGEWTHLNIPMRYEPDRHCVTVLWRDEYDEPERTWEDPRQVEGELLCPERMDEKEVRMLERTLGPDRAAGQLQQRPSMKGGGIFKRAWWQVWGNLEDEDDPTYRKFPAFDYVVASLDTAYTEEQENDYSALTIWGVWSGRTHPITPTILDQMGNRISSEGRWRDFVDTPKLMLAYAWKDRLELHSLVTRAAETCRKYRVDRLLIEAKASGISVAQEIRRLYAGESWGVQLVNPGRLDKVARAYSVQHLFSEGLVYAPYVGDQPREWADMVMTNMASFPKAAHDDLTDSAVQALTHLRANGFANLSQEMEREIDDSLQYRPSRATPLYPGCG